VFRLDCRLNRRGNEHWRRTRQGRGVGRNVAHVIATRRKSQGQTFYQLGNAESVQIGTAQVSNRKILCIWDKRLCRTAESARCDAFGRGLGYDRYFGCGGRRFCRFGWSDLLGCRFDHRTRLLRGENVQFRDLEHPRIFFGQVGRQRAASQRQVLTRCFQPGQILPIVIDAVHRDRRPLFVGIVHARCRTAAQAQPEHETSRSPGERHEQTDKQPRGKAQGRGCGGYDPIKQGNPVHHGPMI